MNSLAAHKPTVPGWETIVSARMSLYTGPQCDTELTSTEQHDYLAADRDGPERNYNADLVRAAIQFDTLLMLPDTEAGVKAHTSLKNSLVEGRSYSIKGDNRLVTKRFGADTLSDLPVLVTQSSETIIPTSAKKLDKISDNWASGDSMLP